MRKRVGGFYGAVILDAAREPPREPKDVPPSKIEDSEPRCKCTHGLYSHYLCGGGDETRCLTGCGCGEFEPPRTQVAVNMGRTMSQKNQIQVEAQQHADEVSSELNELYRQVREKESELDKHDRIANPEDYE